MRRRPHHNGRTLVLFPRRVGKQRQSCGFLRAINTGPDLQSLSVIVGLLFYMKISEGPAFFVGG